MRSSTASRNRTGRGVRAAIAGIAGFLPELILGGSAVLTGFGFFDASRGFPPYTILAFLVLPGMIIFTSIARIRAPWERTFRDDARFSTALMIASYALVSATGGGGSPFYPVVFLMMAGISRFHSPPVSVVSLLVAIAIESMGFLFNRHMSASAGELAAHLAFLGAFAILNTVIRRFGKFVTARRDTKLALEQTAAAAKRAMDYGLLAKGSVKEGLERVGVKADRALSPVRKHLLELLRVAASARTSALFWYDKSEGTFRLHDYSTIAGGPRPKEKPPNTGLLGSLLKVDKTLAIRDFRSLKGGLSYYDSKVDVTGFMGTIIKKKDDIVGALCLDRSDSKPFDEELRPLLYEAGAFFLRLIEDERYLIDLTKEREEVHRFYEAAKNLNKALTMSQVHQRTAEALETVADADVTAFTTLEQEERRDGKSVIRHRISFVKGVMAKYLENLEFEDTGAVSLVCRRGVVFNKSVSEMKRRGAPMGILGNRELGREIDSILIIPLVAQDKVAGTLLLASSKQNAFPDDVVERVRIIANQAAVCLLNAELYAGMEKMAVTDGLTGLYNHRYFQDRLDDYLARAERNKQIFSILLTDIDHFKQVNDTHGHQVGDKVLVSFAGLLTKAVRKVDLVARYGGEEFILILDGTDRPGAVRFAERIREEASRMLFAGTEGPFSVTISVGVSTYPEDALQKAMLVERADQAMYYSKEHGRNRTTTWVQAKNYTESEELR